MHAASKTTVIPEAVRALALGYAAEPAADGMIAWSPDAWRRALPRAGRRAVSSLAKLSVEAGGQMQLPSSHVTQLGGDVVALMLAAIISSYGMGTKGPQLAAAVLTSNGRSLRRRLKRQAEAAANGPDAAWTAFTKTHVAAELEPPIASGFAYLAAGGITATGVFPLPADVAIAWAMWDQCGVLRADYSRAGYLEYVTSVHGWAAASSDAPSAHAIIRALSEIGRTVRTTS